GLSAGERFSLRFPASVTGEDGRRPTNSAPWPAIPRPPCPAEEGRCEMSTPETPEGRVFQKALARPAWPQVKSDEVKVAITSACHCGCGRPAGVELGGLLVFSTRTKMEIAIMEMRSAADQLWGPKP